MTTQGKAVTTKGAKKGRDNAREGGDNAREGGEQRKALGHRRQVLALFTRPAARTVQARTSRRPTPRQPGPARAARRITICQHHDVPTHHDGQGLRAQHVASRYPNIAMCQRITMCQHHVAFNIFAVGSQRSSRTHYDVEPTG